MWRYFVFTCPFPSLLLQVMVGAIRVNPLEVKADVLQVCHVPKRVLSQFVRKDSKFQPHGNSSTAARLWVHAVKGKVFPEHLSTADWAIAIIKEVPKSFWCSVGIAGEAAVTSGSHFSFLSNLWVWLWSFERCMKLRSDKSFWSPGLFLCGLSCRGSSKRTINLLS